MTVSLALSAVLGLALAAALWWAYFGVGDDERAEQAMMAADPAARPALALTAYSYPYVPLLLGVVALASGVKEAIVRTGSTLPAALMALLTLIVAAALAVEKRAMVPASGGAGGRPPEVSTSVEA